MSMKLLIDTKAKKVLFAKASKDCIDFLFHILSLPMANVASLLREGVTMGSLTKLYESVENLDETYIQPNQKDALLKPRPSLINYSVPDLLPNNVSDDQKYSYKHRCLNCNKKMKIELPFVAHEGGFVKEVITYMVMDDLEVTPMSSISSIMLLNKFNVKKVSSLEEKMVSLGRNEALQLLKAIILHSEKVLTDVFIKCVFREDHFNARPYTEPALTTKKNKEPSLATKKCKEPSESSELDDESVNLNLNQMTLNWMNLTLNRITKQF